MVKTPTHLDNAGSPLVFVSAFQAWSEDVRSNCFGNPHSGNVGGISERIQSVRDSILSFLNVSGREYTVIFTANTTAACKLIAESVDWSNGHKFIYLKDS